MSEVDRDAIRARLNDATEGPWKWSDGRVPDLIGRAGTPDTYEYDVEVMDAEHYGGCGCRSACTLELNIIPSDAEFIAHSRTDVEALLDLADDLEKEVQRFSAVPGVWVCGVCGRGAFEHSRADLPSGDCAMQPTWKTSDEETGTLRAEVRRLSQRPTWKEVTLVARDIVNDGRGVELHLSGNDAGRIATAVLALFPTVEGGETSD